MCVSCGPAEWQRVQSEPESQPVEFLCLSCGARTAQPGLCPECRQTEVVPAQA